MIYFIIIFFVAIIISVGVLSYRYWEIQNGNEIIAHKIKNPISKITFRSIERNVLHLLKYFIQKIVLVLAKYWFIVRIRTKKFLMGKWPKIYSIFEKKPFDPNAPLKPSFVTKALLESKVKIKRLKKKIHEDHDMDISE